MFKLSKISALKKHHVVMVFLCDLTFNVHSTAHMMFPCTQSVHRQGNEAVTGMCDTKKYRSHLHTGR